MEILIQKIPDLLLKHKVYKILLMKNDLIVV